MNYYFLMNDRKSFKLINPKAVLNNVPSTSVPVDASIIDVSFDVMNNKVLGDLYWNFDNNPVIDFDYLNHHGHIFSSEFYDKISDFKFAPHVKKKLHVWMNGKFTGETLIYLVFKRPINNDTDEIKKRYRFIDLNKTDWQYGKRNQIVPTGNVVLNENAFDYDILELSEFSVVHSQIVISENVKLSIEKNAVKGVKIIDLNKGINEYLVDNHIEISRYLPKVKKKIP